MRDGRAVARLVAKAGVETQEGGVGDEAGRSAGDQIARAPGLPRFVPEPADPSLGSRDDRAQLVGLVRPTKLLGEGKQVAIGAKQDHRHADIGDAKGTLATNPGMVPAKATAELHKGEIPIVFELGGA